MRYLVLLKLRGKLSGEVADRLKNDVRDQKGYKTVDFYWLMGPYDAAWIVETGETDNLARKIGELQDVFETTTMVTLPFELLAP